MFNFGKNLYYINQALRINRRFFCNLYIKQEQKLPSAIPLSILNKVKIINPKKEIQIQNPTNIVKNVIVPTSSFLKINQIKEKILPTTKINDQIIKITAFGTRSKFSMNMLRIKRRKMRKHQLKKFRKRYRSFIMNKDKDREILKEKNFRAELLAKIREAENFDAEKYVDDILHTINSVPFIDTKKQKFEKLLDLIRKHAYETKFVKPKFSDPVPDDIKKLE